MTGPSDRAKRKLRLTYAVLVVAVLGIAGVSLLVGHGNLQDPALRETLLRLRAGRMAAAFLAGAALSIGGVAVQGLFRNPLASPSVLGTTAGASLGGQMALVGFQALLGGRAPAGLAPEMVVPLGCMVGALAALGVLLAVARQRDDLLVLLLTGFILSSLFLSMGSFLTSLAQERWELARAVVSFTLGDVSGTGGRQIAMAAPLVVIGGAAAWLWARSLDVLLSGEEEASSLGVDVTAVRRWCVVWTAVLTSAAVSLGGNVSFVGLVVPHALRPFTGVEHRRLTPAAALAGGGFLVGCDVLSRVVPSRTEVPLGVVTGLIGAPLFLGLLLRMRREEGGVYA